MRPIPRLVSLLVLPAALLSGCVSEPTTTPPPTSAAPPFASDEEALAAAEEAYGAYLAVSDQVIRDGGVGVERLREFLSEELFALEQAAHERLRTNGWHGVGATTFDLTIQGHDHDSVTSYSCDDLTNAQLVDSLGTSVVSPDRADRIPFEVEFDAIDAMRIIRKDLWSGGGVC